MVDKYTCIDLFCGCGGFSKGFEEAGFNIALGTDIWKDALVTYKKNFPNAATVEADVTDLSSEELLDKANLKANDIDVIIGGPPCQGFSVSGFRMIDDPRNKLYKSYVRLVNEIRPKVFVMENVPGLIRLFDGKVGKQVLEDFSNIGYHVFMKVLVAADYGVPQIRQRVFFVGLNKDKISAENFIFPLREYGTEEKPYITCREALSDLDFIGDTTLLEEHDEYVLPAQSDYQRQMREGSVQLLNHVTTIHTERTRSIIAMVPDGGNYKDLPQELWSTRKVHIAWTRMNSEKPCFTIDTGHNHHFHYRANRVPTVRESARIQSFPDTFEFIGIKTNQLKQVGNAVPPLMAKALAKQILQLLRKEK